MPTHNPICAASRSSRRVGPSKACPAAGTAAHPPWFAPPPFRGPIVLTIHDLSTVRFPETQEAARARHFARALGRGAHHAARIATPTEAIAREVIDLLGVPRDRVRAIPHGVAPGFT